MKQLRTLKRTARDKGVIPPSQQTLDKYGLTLREWLTFLDDNNWSCRICGNRPNSGRFVTDHEHAPRWASKPPEERKQYVRGVICWHCNRYLLVRGISVERAYRVARYLEDYEARRPSR